MLERKILPAYYIDHICILRGRTGFDGDYVGRISKPQLLEAALKKPKLNINADKNERAFAPQLVAA